MVETYIDSYARNEAEKANERLEKLIKTIVDNNNVLLSIIDAEEERLLPKKSFGRSDSEKLSNEICKTRFNAGEKCCNLIVSCLYYLQDNFSREERNTLIKNVNNKNKK